MDEDSRRRRVQGTGSIWQRSCDGLWMGAVDVGYANGHRNRRVVSSKRREVVEAKLAALLALPEDMRASKPRRHSRRSREEQLATADAKATHTVEQWLAKRDAVRCCVYCGGPGPLVVDHATPISRGGTNGIANVVPACMTCNGVKGNRNAAEFIRDRALGIA